MSAPEFELLRRENAKLRAPSVIVVVLIVIDCVVTPVSLTAVWTHNEVSDSVETSR